MVELIESVELVELVKLVKLVSGWLEVVRLVGKRGQKKSQLERCHKKHSSLFLLPSFLWSFCKTLFFCFYSFMDSFFSLL